MLGEYFRRLHIKQATMISYIITLAFIVLLVTSIEDAVAQQVDEPTRQCLQEVRELILVGLKLSAADLREGTILGAELKMVNEYCEQGEVVRARTTASAIVTYRKCTQNLNDHIKNNYPDVDINLLTGAYRSCRRGDLQEAIKIVETDYRKRLPIEQPQKLPWPKIKKFWITPAVSKPGDQITFHWHVENADSIRLYEDLGDDDLGDIELRGGPRNGVLDSSFSTTLDKTTTFLLVAADRAGRKTGKNFIAQVTGSTKPKETCTISGKLTGKWRQEIREREYGPLSTWTVRVYIYDGNSELAFAVASVKTTPVTYNGTYSFEKLEAGKDYTIKPEWTSTPSQGIASCSAGKTKKGPSFLITGKPHYEY